MLELALPAKNVVVLNPRARLALCTLWTPPEYVLKILESHGLDLSPENSPLALIGGLFGGGLKIMLRNLAHNPQIERVLLYGKDFSGGGEQLANFFAGRVERTGRKRTYLFANSERRELELVAIKGRDSVYIMDDLLLPEHFERPPAIEEINFGRPEELLRAVHEFAAMAPSKKPLPPRLLAELPRAETTQYPSETRSHVVTGDSITETWEKLLCRLSRFAAPVVFRDGKRRHELLNMKAVILKPGLFDREELARLNISEAEIAAYKESLLSARFSEADGSYSYGNRMRAYFGRDMLALAAADLAQNLDSRHGFITLWDNGRDLEASESPCLVSLFFRKIGDKIDLTATFRSHNATRAWPRNAFGLHGIMEEVARLANNQPGRSEERELAPGALTVLSLSISIDPSDLDNVQGHIDDYKNRPRRIRQDPCGYVKIAADQETGEIVLQHYSHEDELLDEYRDENPAALAQKICRAEVVSDISHALYIGMELERQSQRQALKIKP